MQLFQLSLQVASFALALFKTLPQIADFRLFFFKCLGVAFAQSFKLLLHLRVHRVYRPFIGRVVHGIGDWRVYGLLGISLVLHVRYCE